MKQYKKLLNIGLLILFTIFTGQYASADEDKGKETGQSTENVSSKDKSEDNNTTDNQVIELEKMVVTATKTNHVIGDVPIGTTVITKDELEEKNIHDLADAMKMIPGLYQYSSGVKIYGLDIAHTSLLIDGQKQYKCPGRMPILDRYPIEMIEGIEIKKGASGVLSGGETSGGVIHLITKSAPDKPTFTASTGFGSHGKQVHYIGGGNKIDKFGYRLDFINNKYHSIDPENDSFTYDDFWGSLEYEFSPKVKTVLKPSYYNQDSPGWKQRKYSLNSITEWYPDDVSKAYFRGSMLRLIWTESDIKLNTYEAEGYYNRMLSENNFATIGYHYQGDYADNFTTEMIDQYTNSVYFQDEMTFNPLTVLLGARWVDHNWWGSDIFPQAGLLYRITNNFKWRASVEKGFRSAKGPLSFQGLKFFMGRWMRSDPNLDPERSWSYQTGLEYQVNERVLTTLSLFLNELTDTIETVRTSEIHNDNTVFLVTNTSDARTQGGELNIIVQFTDNLSGRLGYYYLDSENKTTGNELTYDPNHMADFTLNYKNQPLGLGINLQGGYVGERYSDKANEQKLDSYFLLNLKITKKLTKKMRTFIEVTNVLDEEYTENNDEMPGIEVFGGISLNF
jgi:outer membrane receptor protein involved in Fe transport